MTDIFLYARNDLSIPEGVLVMTVALMGWMWRLRAGWDEYPALGSFRQDPRALRPARRKAVRQSEEDRAEVRTGSRNRRKSVGAVCVNRRTTRPALLRRLRSRNPSFLKPTRKRHYRFHHRRSSVQNHKTIPNPTGLFDASFITPLKSGLYKRLHALSIS